MTTNNVQVGAATALIVGSFVIAFVIGQWFPLYWGKALPFLISAFFIGLAIAFAAHWKFALPLVGLIAAAIGYLYTMPEMLPE